MAARLSVLSGPFASSVFEVEGAKFLIGREEDCDLRPDSRLVSRHHCVFLQDGYTMRLRDLGSKNGTFVNGRRIGGTEQLADGDVVAVGEMMLKVDLSAVGTSAAQRAHEDTAGPSMAQTDVFDGETLRGQGDITEAPTVSQPAKPNTAASD